MTVSFGFRSVRVASALVAGAIMLSGCATFIPLVATFSGHGLCMPPSSDGEYQLGSIPLQNRGSVPETITKVQLVGAPGVTLLESHVVPIRFEMRDGDRLSILAGDTAGWSPDQHLGSVWKDRRVAAGASILPGEPHDQNLVLRLRADQPQIRVSQVAGWYRSGGAEHVEVIDVGLQTSFDCSAFPDGAPTDQVFTATPEMPGTPAPSSLRS